MTIDYSRQLSLTNLSVPRTVTIIGTGAIGCWVSYFAALGGVEKIIIYTFGQVKPTDIARFPFPPSSLGKPYAYALPNLLFSIRPDVEIIIRGAFRPDIDDIEGTVFNCAASELVNFDEKLYKSCQKEGVKYYSGYYSEHSISVVDYASKELPRASLDPVPAWSGSAAMAGLHIFYASSVTSDATVCRTINAVTGTTDTDSTVKLFVNEGAAR